MARSHRGLTCPKLTRHLAFSRVNYLRGRSGQISRRGGFIVSFIVLLRKTKAVGQSHRPSTSTAEQQMPWVERLRKAKSQALARSADPWMLRLERVRGMIGYDGVERISTQDLFDFLKVPQRARTAGACRRLAALMRECGWTSMKARGLGQSGFRDQVRGYARDTRAHSSPPGV
jgi:hypothetical protein